MSRHYTPKQKRLHGVPSVKGMKSVRINDKTVIMVQNTISDEDARERFLSRYKAGPRSADTYMPPKIKEEIAQVESMGSLEDLQAVIDETQTVEAE